MKHTLGLTVLLLAFATGCSMYGDAMYSSMAEPGYAAREELTGSLFEADTAVLSNAAIREILSSKITIPKKCNMAVVQLRPYRNYYYGRAGREGEHLKIITNGLAESPRIGRATQIPEILLPEKLSIPVLRQAAARLQCELVLIYRVTEDVRYRGHIFTRDTAKVYSSVEGVLLHTRTGILPFTVIADQEHESVETKKDKQERGFHERIRHEATVKALGKLNAELRGFLKEIETEAKP